MMNGLEWQLRTTRARYGFAVLAAAVALLLMVGWQRLGMEPLVAPFLFAIMLTGWYAGGGPVILTTGLSALGFHFSASPPPPDLMFGWTHTSRLFLFVVFAGSTAWFSAARRTTAERLERARNELKERVVARTTELRRSEEYLLAAQLLSHTGSWAWRIDTGDITWSEECARIMVGDPAVRHFSRQRLTQLWHPDARDGAERSFDAGLREKRLFESRLRIVRPDGQTRLVRCWARPVLNDAGEVVEIIGIMMDVTDRRRTAHRLRRAREQATAARFAARLDERTRLALELHDTLLQGFTGVGLNLVAVTNRMDGPPAIVSALRDVIVLAQGTLEKARRAIWDIQSDLPAGEDLATALQVAAEAGVRGSGLSLAFVVEGPVRSVEPAVNAALLRVVREAITNVVRHAAARSIRVLLTYETRRLRLAITDDGQGFTVDPDVRAYSGHLGLLGMRERASQAHGTLSVRSSPGHGTEIVLLVDYARDGRGQSPGSGI